MEANNETNCPTLQVHDTLAINEINNAKNEKENLSSTQPKTLQQEFSLININIPNIEVKKL